MSQPAVSFVATVYAWDTSAGTYKTGDSANITLYWTKDGTQSVTTNACSEVSAANAPGQYKVTLTSTEATCTAGTLGGKSATAGIIIIPAQFTFDNADFTSTQKTSLGTAVAASAVASVTGNVGGNVVGSVGSVTGAVGSVTAAVSVTGDLSATMKTSVTTAATATAMAESYSADGSTMTTAQALYELKALLSEFSMSGTTMTTKKLDGSTTAATYTLDSATTPTSITRAS